MAYKREGSSLEACTCEATCPATNLGVSTLSDVGGPRVAAPG
jgi:hypothetical protein